MISPATIARTSLKILGGEPGGTTKNTTLYVPGWRMAGSLVGLPSAPTPVTTTEDEKSSLVMGA